MMYSNDCEQTPDTSRHTGDTTLDQSRHSGDTTDPERHGESTAVVVSSLATSGLKQYDSYEHRKSIVLGGVIVTCAGLSLILALTGTFALRLFPGILLMPAIAETLDIIAGGLAIGAAKRKTRCVIIATMVLCIISSVFGGIILLAFIGKMLITRYNLDSAREYNAFISMESVALVLSVVGFIASIWCSTLGCKIFCCGKRIRAQVVYVQPEPGVTTENTSPMESQAVLYIPNVAPAVTENRGNSNREKHSEVENTSSFGEEPPDHPGRPGMTSRTEDQENLVANMY